MSAIGPSRDFVISGKSSFLEKLNFSNMSTEAARDVRIHILDIAAGITPDNEEMKDRAKFLVDKLVPEPGGIEKAFYTFVFGNRDEIDYGFATDETIPLPIRFTWNFYFKTNRKNTSVASKRPPARIFQFWDVNPPEDVLALTQEWREAAGNENYQLFTDESARSAVFDSLGKEGVEAYDSCWHPAMKSDFFRFVEVYERGGIYIDADMQKSAHFSAFIENYNLDAHFYLCTNRFSPSIHSSILVGAPKMKVYQICVENCLSNLQRLDGKKESPMSTTGPGVLFQAMIKTYGIADEFDATSSGEFESNFQCGTSYPTSYRKDNRSWQKAMGWQ